MKKTLVFVGALIGAGILAFIAKDYFIKPPPVNPGGYTPIATVVPTEVTATVQALLPADDQGVIQVDIPPIQNTPGTDSTQHLVITSGGNTLVVTTETVTLKFKLEPKIVFGYTGDLNAGIGLSFFQFWRLDTDALLVYEITEKSFRAGIGESYNVYSNTSLGVMLTWNTELKPKIGAYLSIKF